MKEVTPTSCEGKPAVSGIQKSTCGTLDVDLTELRAVFDARHDDDKKEEWSNEYSVTCSRLPRGSDLV